MIPAAAVEAAARGLAAQGWGGWDAVPNELRRAFLRDAHIALEAAAPYMQQEVDLMRWKLNALSKWADAMIDESYYPQYGRDVKTILDVSSIEETKEDFGDD